MEVTDVAMEAPITRVSIEIDRVLEPHRWAIELLVNGHVDVLGGGHRKSSVVANESPRGHGSLRVVRWVSR